MRWVRFSVRFAYIQMICAATVFAYFIGRLGTLFVRGKARRASRVARLRGRLLRWSMARLGATFIKLGQVMSTRPDLFAPEFIAELRKLQDKLPAFSFKRARRTLETDLGSTLEAAYSEFDQAPVAAASVAQVHRARLHDGTEVAVKILRPNVRQLAQQDAAILMLGARVGSLIPAIRLGDPVGHLSELVDGILRQTDLRIELENNRRFTENFKDVEGVFFPEVYPDFCSEHVLTMEFIRGHKVDELPDGDHKLLSKRLRDMFLKMSLEDGFLHADLHPGNLLITESGEVAVFDLGLAKLISDDLLVQFIDFNRCMAMGGSADFLNHLRTFHTYLDDVDWDAVATDVGVFMDKFRSQSVAELEFNEMINDMFALGRKYRIRPVADMALFLVGTVTAEGIGKMLEPDANSIGEMAEFLLPILQRRGLLEAAMTAATISGAHKSVDPPSAAPN